MIGKIQRIPLRQVWRHEERDFSAWLCDNIDVLNEAIGLELAEPQRERAAGTFSVDLSGEDANGEAFIIENQLERSDHDHLGKLLTYAAAFNAKTAIWIVADPRPEHTSAVAWLNQCGATSFYLLRAEAIQIDDSKPALHLTRVIGPSDEIKAVGASKRETQVQHDAVRAFWHALLTAARETLPIHSNCSASSGNWVAASAGHRGMNFVYWIRRDSWKAGLEIYDDSAVWNKAAFDALLGHRQTIESDAGVSLDWERCEGQRGCKVTLSGDNGGYRSLEAAWPVIHCSMIEAMSRVSRAVVPHFRAVVSEANALEAAGRLTDDSIAGESSISSLSSDTLV
ncbi:MAG: DUF4268 domain-containing protein [Phycisphaeraceae bacterium]|nr:MAG: DUF4268 domain-containing protein [Phycisphaeraceae bacterium]